MLCYILNIQKRIHCNNWCDFAVNGRFWKENLTLTLFWCVTLTSHDLETTSKQLAGHMLARNDTLFVIVHHVSNVKHKSRSLFDDGHFGFV